MKDEEILEKMGLSEKAGLCSGATNWLTKGSKKYGIEQLFMANGPYGVQVIESDRDTSFLGKIKKIADTATKLISNDDSFFMGTVVPATSFPCSALLASTWDRDLVSEIGNAIAEECVDLGVNILLGPGVNIKRTPLCGRNFEYYSEDPFLAGEIASAFVSGVQAKNVAACLKHFALNNSERRRFTASSEIDERTLREIYLYPFEAVVKKANPWCIMASYNKVNGVYASENSHLINDILKGEWAYDGLVMSDWGAVSDRVKALNAGLDLQMPGPRDADDRLTVEAAKKDAATASKLNDATSRFIRLERRVAKPAPCKADYDAHHKLSVKAAEAGIVLLKNKENVLPFRKLEKDSIAIIGQAAKEPNYLKGGSSFLNPTQLSTPYDSITEYLRGSMDVIYAAGYNKDDNYDSALIDEAVNAAKNSAYTLIVARSGVYDYSEGIDRRDITLPEAQIKLILEISKVQPNAVVAVICGSAFELCSWEKSVGAVLALWHSGQGIGEALRNVVFGLTNPSGKLSETFPIRLADTPSYLNPVLETDKTVYGENVFVGYRYYDKKEMNVSYPFGHGLSYTSFEYSKLSLDRELISKGENLSVTFKIKNTGSVAGSEIAQLYVRDPISYLPRPECELKAFEKVRLEPGEEKEIVLTLDTRAFSYYCPGKGGWVAESGEFELLVGASSRDIRLSKKITMINGDNLKGALNGSSTFRELYYDEKGREALRKLFGNIKFKILFNEESPFFPIIMSVPVFSAEKNNYITPKQCEELERLIK